ncbi:putative late blight resistance protein homolog R1A-4 [Ipomoea triloba]|uniref:putative late blight resistance protein homolog R1A-4 n=1 Tax=Ipomoea triloba TaxID=35885 RepID=UPI00125D9C21|nr:putative late blight resistance protein homolog R1A-4 [Ipomoea triloba]
MACVPLTSLMNTIQFEFLKPRPPVILDEDTARMMNSLYQNVGFLLAFLEEFEKKPGNDDAAIKDLEAKIRDLAHSAEDGIESNLTNIYMEAGAAKDKDMMLCQNLRQVANDTHQFVNRIKREYYDSTVQDSPKVHTLSSDLESISLSESSQLFSKPKVGHSSFNLLTTNCTAWMKYIIFTVIMLPKIIFNLCVSKLSIWLGKSPKPKVEGRMVGHSSELNTIKDQLTRHPFGERKVISILGMGGIGKTTLARRLYEDPSVISHFEVCAWTTVSQEVNLRRILCDLLLQSFSFSSTQVNTNGSTGELAQQLQRRLKCTRYLVVVDDVWETSVWDYLTRCFPESGGSRVLLTTQLKEIADYTTTSGTYLHNLHFLDSNQSWDLFCNNVFCKQPLPSEFETIGRNIVDKCRGLPLAIVVVAGLVSKLNNTLDDWKNVEREISCLASTDLGEQCSRILNLSYNHLPQHLKACFLYLGVFYENSEIPVKKLVRLWVAEGFVKLVSDKRLEEVGVEYLQDLVSRSLVLIHKCKPNGQIKTCRMHNLLHGLCIREARKLNLLYIKDDGYDHVGACRWLSFRSPKPKNYDIIRNNYKKARSVLCLYNDDEIAMVNDPKPVRFSLLRVLDLTSPLYTKGVYVPFTDLSDLVLLKYLAWFVGSEGLEIILSKNQKLQTLLVSHSAAEWEEDSSLLPSTIWGSPQLRHLEFKNSLRVEPPSMVKEKLQTLYWLSISHCTEEVFSMIPNINTLGILCKRGSISHSNGTYSLKFLQCLDQLEDLTIESDYPIFEHLPPRCIDVFPRKLRKLKLSGTHLPLEDIEAIALLPSLEVLKLKTDSLLGPE